MRFKHDCTNCQSLGEFGKYDLYICITAYDETVLARYSDDGPDYASMSLQELPLSRLPYLIEAKRRAEEMGLIPKPKPEV